MRPPTDGSDAELWWLRGYEAAVKQERQNQERQGREQLINVLFLWYDTTTRPQTQQKVWAKMSQVPDVGHHVHIPLGTFNDDGEEDTECKQVKRVYWVKDESSPDSWHAEVWMYDKGEFR